jgi:hypothetical protein
MLDSAFHGRLVGGAFLAAMLTAPLPAAGAKVGDIIKNREKHLEANFTRAALTSDVKGRLDTFKVEFKPFRTITVDASVAVQVGDDRWTERVATRLVNLKDGFIREETERFRNDVPFSQFFAVSYLGLVPLRYQTLKYDRAMASPIFEQRSIIQFPDNLLKPVAKGEYLFTSKTAISGTLFGTRDREIRYLVKEIQPASQLAPELTGDAVLIDTEAKLDKVPSAGRDTYCYLPDYGVSIYMKYTSKDGTDTFSIDKITIQ